MSRLSNLSLMSTIALLVFSSAAYANPGIDSVSGVDLPISGGGVPAMIIGGGQNVPAGEIKLLSSLSTDSGAITAGTIQSTGWGTGTITANGVFVSKDWDAEYNTTDSITNKSYQLIGTYHGWDPNSIYIGGYNAGNSNIAGTAQTFANATSVSFGGNGYPVNGAPFGPAMFVDLVNHKVGIGNVAPQVTLDVSGNIKVGADSTSCADATAGSIRFNSTDKVFEGCNGTSWVSLTPQVFQVSNSCASGWCSVDCPAGSTVTGGGYSSYWGENVDYNGPAGNGWAVGDSSWQAGQGNIVIMARCLKTN